MGFPANICRDVQIISSASLYTSGIEFVAAVNAEGITAVATPVKDITAAEGYTQLKIVSTKQVQLTLFNCILIRYAPLQEIAY